MGIVLRVILVFALSGCGSRREIYEYESYELVKPKPAPLVVPLPPGRKEIVK